MENATKALLITGGIFIIIMILSLVVVFWDQMSAYFTEKHDSTMLGQLVEFNSKFENYNGQTIRGNELVSIMNMIIDYNNYQNGVEGYDRVEIIIDLKGHQGELRYKNETSSESIIKVSDNKITNKTNDNAIAAIAGLSATLVNTSGISNITDTKLQKMSAGISNIVDDNITDTQAKTDYIEYRAQLLKRILGYEVEDSEINTIKMATYKYYQFTQFKRALFKCTKVSYNEQNGRVNEMIFEVELEEDKFEPGKYIIKSD